MEIHDAIRLKENAEARLYEVLSQLVHDVGLEIKGIDLGHVRTGLDKKHLTSVKITFGL